MIAQEYISKWSWVIQSYAGSNKGIWSLPDIGNQVLVVFLYGDIHRPAVLGSMYNWKRRPPVADNPDNNIKVIKTKGTYLLMDDTPVACPSSKRSARPGPGEERMEASIKDGQIRVVIDKDGVHLTNEIGGINIQCRKLKLKGKASHWKAEKDITIKVGGNVNLKAKKALALKAGGDITVKGSTVDLKGSTGVTAEPKAA